ncbi:MerR family transcriptional regulator, glutamine synthetase repressor [Pilibacter termitis]|uniref:MerR family transcriptional regulator, glutamine synthetase repressor n=1 Tax=Pilibacter termitis TaxID=263852 RepID=A0A1T4N8Y3_9ENTE|nr:MerR family transcriptional regulator [Pilibacter termitis]SJZ75682.1 MerR family transcriptional regulator, glutamine synthetase repressor [Pilibacter termitis]
MKDKEFRRSMAVFPMGAVMKLTELSARQIRYYEEQSLIFPERSDGNRRLFSLNDIDVLLEIKDYLSEGLNMAGVKRMIEMKREESEKTAKRALSEEEIRRIFREELLSQGGLAQRNPNAFQAKM